MTSTVSSVAPHPAAAAEAQRGETAQHAQSMRVLRSTQGLHAPLRLAMEERVMQRMAPRLPGLYAHHPLAAQLSGALDTIDFCDVLNSMSNSIYLLSLNSKADVVFRLFFNTQAPYSERRHFSTLLLEIGTVSRCLSHQNFRFHSISAFITKIKCTWLDCYQNKSNPSIWLFKQLRREQKILFLATSF